MNITRVSPLLSQATVSPAHTATAVTVTSARTSKDAVIATANHLDRKDKGVGLGASVLPRQPSSVQLEGVAGAPKEEEEAQSMDVRFVCVCASVS